jgi:release factor glutamine methyltransferase
VKVKDALHTIARELAAHSIEDAHLEAETILMYFLGLTRARLFVALEDELLPGGIEELEQIVQRRIAHEPLAYIIGYREFFGRDFYVAHGVLIPRPETELLVEEALGFIAQHSPRRDPVIAEIGTGSGVIAISLALETPKAKIYATDISSRALEVAAYNCEQHGVGIELLEGDLLAPVPEPVDIIIANLPYVTDEEIEGLADEIKVYEPIVALSGGPDGLDKMRQLLCDVAESAGRLRSGGLILLEVSPAQGEALAAWAQDVLPAATVELVTDLSGMVRALKVVTA